MKLLKTLLFFGSAVAAGYFVYMAYIGGWSGASFAVFKEKIGEKSEETSELIKEKAEDYRGKVVEEGKEQAVGFVRELVHRSLTSVGDVLERAADAVLPSREASESETADLVLPGQIQASEARLPFSIVIRAGVPLILKIQSGNFYSVDWGEGTAQEGEFENEVLVSRVWERTDFYQVVLRVWDEGEWRESILSVQVVE